MKFNINKYEGNYAMHCKTEEEAKIFCRYLDSVGRRWADGTSYMSMTNWNYGPDTCYTFNSGTYCKKTYFLTRNYYTILEFSDFEWDNKNTKRKPVIIYQNGQDVIALDKETGEKAVAKCHPNDEFDFAIGAKIAFGRLYHSQDYIPEGNKAKCKPEFQVGDRVRCIKKDYEIGGINIVNELGVIRETGDSNVLVEFDNNIGGHSGNGKGKDNHCWWFIQNSWRHSKRYHSCQLQKCGERVERMKENGSFETVSVLWNGFVRVPRSNDSTACKNRGISSRQTKKETNHR